MRILLISNQYAPVVGGIEVLLRQLVPELRGRGHELTVLTSAHQTAPDRRYEVEGVTVHRLDLVRAIVRRDPLAIARGRQEALAVLAECAPDLIHAHDIGPYLWATIGRGVPTLTTLHIGLASVGTEQHGVLCKLLPKSAWVTGVSRAVVDEAVALVPEIADRVSVIENGLPASPHPKPPDPTRRRVVAAGRMVPQKGFDVLLRAFAEVVRRVPDAELVLVGDGPSANDLRALTSELGIAGSVVMPGAVRHADMPAVLALASVVAIPSRHEGMPLIALEAAAAGRAVVATPAQGLADVVVDGATGMLVPREDPAALADALTGLLGDPARAARQGAAGRAMVTERYSLAAAADAYDVLYRQLTAA